jgi:hypothetical protein
LSSTTELAELQELTGSMRRCVTSLASRHGDSGVVHHHNAGERIPIPDTQYDTDSWRGVDDEGLDGVR